MPSTVGSATISTSVRGRARSRCCARLARAMSRRACGSESRSAAIRTMASSEISPLPSPSSARITEAVKLSSSRNVAKRSDGRPAAIRTARWRLGSSNIETFACKFARVAASWRWNSLGTRAWAMGQAMRRNTAAHGVADGRAPLYLKEHVSNKSRMLWRE